MHKEFNTFSLNSIGAESIDRISRKFNLFLDEIIDRVPPGRELSIVRTKLEEACFFAKKGIELNPENQL